VACKPQLFIEDDIDLEKFSVRDPANRGLLKDPPHFQPNGIST
jgi:hypothetical protein